MLQTSNGHRYALPKGLIPFQENAICETGSYEPATSRVIDEILSAGDVVIEGGACCGYHALNIARAVGAAGKVHCFEANPLLHAFLHENIRTNGYAQIASVYRMGLWEQEGMLDFPLLPHGLGGASFKKPLQRARCRTVPVRVVGIDSFFEHQAIDLIRMDIEGAEFEVIRGAQKLLREQQPAIIMEWIAENTRSGQSMELYELLVKAGYHIYRIAYDSLIEVRRPDDLLGMAVDIEARDILCVARSMD